VKSWWYGSRLPVALLLLLACNLARSAGEPLPVARFEGESATVVLLGSVHMAYPDLYPLRDGIENAFAAADTLVVEIDIRGDKALHIQQLFLEAGTLPPGQTLKDQLAPETVAALDEYLAKRGLPLAPFERLQPGLVVVTLSTLRLAELGLDPQWGVEQHFLRRLQPGQAVMELETAEQQVALLLEFPDADRLLAQSLQQLEQADSVLGPLYSAWLAGDLEELDRLLLREERAANPEFEPVYQRLYDQRNAAMAGRIEAMLRGQGDFFVVVGAGHLVGEQGIIRLLSKAGFHPLPLN
jgi:uncharacterized protein YbaP (TraB family)